MSVILLADPDDFSVNEVAEWLTYYKEPYFTINFASLLQNVDFDYQLTDEISELRVNNGILASSITSVWFRSDTSKSSTANWPDNSYTKTLKNHLFWEVEALKHSIFSGNGKCKWLSNYPSTQLNKILVLRQAKKVGLHFPEIIITNNKNALISFFKKNGTVICKAAYENISNIKTDEGYLKQFVEEINESTINNLPDTFFPSFFQVKIPKHYDVRVFYLNGKFYSMAIYSNCLDYRADYDAHRNVPLMLPEYLQVQIKTLMDNLNLNTGSLDFVKSSEDGKFYFLEVNPNGQFGMVSVPCNYYIEKEIAKFLCNES